VTVLTVTVIVADGVSLADAEALALTLKEGEALPDAVVDGVICGAKRGEREQHAGVTRWQQAGRGSRLLL
jgi:hypothetical protein